MLNEIKLTEGKVIEIINKYNDLIKIKDICVKFNEQYYYSENDKYKPILIVEVESDIKMGYENRFSSIKIVISPNKITNGFTIKFSKYIQDDVQFSNIKRFKAVVEMIEELQQIDLFHLPEFLSYMSMKEQEKHLQEEKEKLEKELIKKQEEIETQLENLRKRN